MSREAALGKNANAKLRLLMKSLRGRGERALLSLYADANRSLHSGSRSHYSKMHEVSIGWTTFPEEARKPLRASTGSSRRHEALRVRGIQF